MLPSTLDTSMNMSDSIHSNDLGCACLLYLASII